MIKGSEIRKADFPIEPPLLDRWSPRSMSGEEISRGELMQPFQAARGAPSSFNANSGELFMGAAAPSIGQHSSSYWSKGTSHGRRMPPSLSCSFRERHSITITNPPSPIPTTLARHGRISRCKVSSKTSWCTEWKASIMNAQESSCAFRMNFKWRRWRQSADPAQRSCSRRNSKSVRAQ